MTTSSEPSKMKAGDVVRLKSGGPLMSAEWVDHIIERPVAFCRWIDGRDAVRSAFFKLEVLELASPAGERSTS